jgi:lipoprotein-anchoring transpeptidase ErfK/SrfK
MTEYDRNGSHGTEPYVHDRAARQRMFWKRRLAVGVPFALALALIVTLVVAAVGPGATAPSAAGVSNSAASNARLASLLLPNSGSPSRSSTVVRQSASSHAVAVTSSGGAVAHHGSAGSAERSRSATESDLAMVPTRQVVAHLEHSTAGYPGRTALMKNRTVPGSWYGYPSILPVIAKTRDRLEVRLAQRPDEATTWIKRSAAVLTVTHWAILVNISQHWLYVFHDGIQQASFPVGNGATNTPTPTGTYFVAFHAPPTNSGYGSVMMETSAHSRAIEHFEGGNDAIIAIHGPVGSDAQIGNHGAAISNGCIRMHDWDLNQVKHVPNGAPVILTPY